MRVYKSVELLRTLLEYTGSDKQVIDLRIDTLSLMKKCFSSEQRLLILALARQIPTKELAIYYTTNVYNKMEQIETILERRLKFYNREIA